MRTFLMLSAVGIGWSLCCSAMGGEAVSIRPPAVPLVAHDPYFSVWSPADRLSDCWSAHWTGKTQALCGLVRVDGKTYRFAGAQPSTAPAMEQRSVRVLPTRTIYEFATGSVSLEVTFLTPALPNDLDVLARPVTYVVFSAKAKDNAAHEVQVYLDITGEWCVDKPEQAVAWSRVDVKDLSVVRMGSQEQPVLAKHGDDLRIDWGHAYLAVAADDKARTAMAGAETSRAAFAANGKAVAQDDTRMPRKANDDWPVLAGAFELGKVGKEAVEAKAMIAYDDEYSIELFQQKLRPYWRRNGMDAAAMLTAAANEYPALAKRCAKFDAEFMKSLEHTGGATYAAICASAYRLSLAAQKIAADPEGHPVMFPKENFSNGCISTVDVIYPAAPLYLLVNPELMKAQLKPVMDYAASPRWPWPFAPHDLGTYPKANGQVYGGGEKTEKDQMPVEESANMLLLLAAVAKAEGHPDFAAKYWPVVTRWAEYLRDKGLDPENQLCTDDFAGHLAHNANLSIKAIVALGAYAQLCEATKHAEDAGKYRTLAEDMAKQWVKMADDGDHYRLAFDKPGTWSQKYNLVWDSILKLNIFPKEIARKEIAFYKKMQKKYGLPLDNRKDYTKLDWLFWTATLTENKADFDALLAPALVFVNETPDRVPLTDWYDTVTAKKVGFQARPVLGGLFIKSLADEATWKQWRKAAK